MSIDKSLYLGVYIKAKSKIKEHKEIDYVCPDGHLSAQIDPFCSRCGKAIIKKETVTSVPVSFYDLLNDGSIPWSFDDEILELSYRNDGYNIFISKSGSYDIMDMDDMDVPLEDADFNYNINEFKYEHAEFIKAITPCYESIEIHYGIVVDYH